MGIIDITVTEGSILLHDIVIQRIQRKANWARFIRYLLQNSTIYLCVLSLIWLVEKRMLGTDARALWIGLLIPLIVAILQWKRHPIVRKQVLLWAERQSGGDGLLLLTEVEGHSAWTAKISQNVEENREFLNPRFSFRLEIKQLGTAGVFLLMCAWIPVKEIPQQKRDSVLISAEKVELLEEITALEEILPDDPAVDELKEQVEQINPKENVESGLEALDALSSQLEQLQSELEQSMQETQELLDKEYTDPSQLEESIKQVEQSLSEDMQKKLKEQEYSLSEEQKEQLQKEIQKIQEQMQEMKEGQKKEGKKGGQKKFSNEDLKKLAEEAKDGGEGEGQSEKGKDGDGDESCAPSEPDCEPGTGGGGTEALTFDEKRLLNMEKSQSESIRTDKEVDWENTVELGQGQGTADQGFQDNYTERAGGEQAQGSSSRQEIPPNQRDIVQKFFTAEKKDKK